jgi:hypothetical protein
MPVPELLSTWAVLASCGLEVNRRAVSLTASGQIDDDLTGGGRCANGCSRSGSEHHRDGYIATACCRALLTTVDVL